MSEDKERIPKPGSLLEKLKNLPDVEDGPDENPYDQARRLKMEEFDKRSRRTTIKTYSTVDQTEGMREVNKRGSIRARSKR